jgi:hypothetical protein
MSRYQIIDKHTSVDMFCSKWISHYISHLRLHLWCDITLRHLTSQASPFMWYYSEASHMKSQINITSKVKPEMWDASEQYHIKGEAWDVRCLRAISHQRWSMKCEMPQSNITWKVKPEMWDVIENVAHQIWVLYVTVQYRPCQTFSMLT